MILTDGDTPVLGSRIGEVEGFHQPLRNDIVPRLARVHKTSHQRNKDLSGNRTCKRFTPGYTMGATTTTCTKSIHYVNSQS